MAALLRTLRAFQTVPVLVLLSACGGQTTSDGNPPADGSTGTTTDAYSSAVLSDAPLAYVRFLGSDAVDVTGKSHLQRTGIAITDDAPAGLKSRSGTFGGSDWLSIEEDWVSLLGSNAAVGTFEAWVKLGTPTSDREGLISSDLDADKSWVAVWSSAEGIGFSRDVEVHFPPGIDAGPTDDAGVYGTTGSGGPPLLHAGTDGAFHHVAATFGLTGCRMNLFVDGSMVGTNDDCVNMTQWPRILVGAGLNAGLGAAHATVADIAIYGSALTPARIQAHYDAATH